MSVPEVVSSGPAGNEFRGACPNRTFSRFTFCSFCGFAAELTVAFGVTAEVVAGVATTVLGAAAEAEAAATGAADLVAVEVDLLAVEKVVPRSNRFFCCAVFFFTTGGV
jgi:hypothetical protein